MDFFESDVPEGDALCSDNACPCDDTVILRGTGYLFVEQDIVEFRRKYPSVREATNAKEVAASAKGAALGVPNYVKFGRIGPVLVCERGARLRCLDLNVASADAAHWWQTGLVPLRATPKQGMEVGKVPDGAVATEGGPPVAFVVAVETLNELARVTAKIRELPSFKKDEAKALANAFEPIMTATYRDLDEMQAQGVDAKELRALRALALFREAVLASAVGQLDFTSEGDIWSDRAIDLWKKSNDILPSAESYLLMGSLLKVRRRYDESLVAFREAERLGTGNAKRAASEAIKSLETSTKCPEPTSAAASKTAGKTSRPWWQFW